MNAATIAQSQGITIITGYMAKAIKSLLEMAKSLIVASIATANFANHQLRPGFSIGISGLTKKGQSLLGMLTRLLEVALLTIEHSKLVKRPGCLVTLMQF